jgi:hypothetical protein
MKTNSEKPFSTVVQSILNQCGRTEPNFDQHDNCNFEGRVGLAYEVAASFMADVPDGMLWGRIHCYGPVIEEGRDFKIKRWGDFDGGYATFVLVRDSSRIALLRQKRGFWSYSTGDVDLANGKSRGTTDCAKTLEELRSGLFSAKLRERRAQEDEHRIKATAAQSEADRLRERYR